MADELVPILFAVAAVAYKWSCFKLLALRRRFSHAALTESPINSM